MTQVLITDTKLDTLAQTISAKSGATLPLTLDEMTTAVSNIVIGGGGSPTLQAKTNIAPTTSSQTITADSGYDGLSSVQINAMPSGSATTPTTTITANPTISVNSSGLITATVSGSKSVTPTVSAGYISSGTAGTVSVSGSNTNQLTTKSAETFTPGTLNQTISSGQYLTGTQIIQGDTDLIASNIKHGVDIFNVTGTFGMKFDNITATPSSRGTTISFTELKAQPIIFACNLEFEGSFSSARTVYSLIYNGTTLSNCTSYRSGSSILCYKYTTCT